MNPYTYAQNSPASYTDPSGHCFVVCAAIGGAIGAAFGYGSQVVGNLTGGKGWGSFSDINWGQVGLSAAVGAVAGGTAGLASGAIGWAAGADAASGWGGAAVSGAVGQVAGGQSERAIANVVSGRNALEGLFNPEDVLGDAVQGAAFGVGFKALGSAWQSLRGGGVADSRKRYW